MIGINMSIFQKKMTFFRSSTSEEKLCYILMFSIFLPFALTAAVLMVAFVHIMTKKEYRQKVFRADGMKWLLAFSVPLFISPLLNGYWLGFTAGIGVAILMLLGLWISGVMKRHIFENCLNIAVFMSIPAALFAYLEKILAVFLPIGGTGVYRSSSFFMNPNYYGGIIEFVGLICLYKLLTNQSTKRRIYYIGVLLMNLAALYLSNSFSAAAALGIAALALLLFNRKFKALAIVFGIGVALVALILIFPNILPRIFGLQSTFSIRMHIWLQSFNAFLQNPLIGIGTLGYWEVSAFENYTLLHQPHAHNVLLDLLLNYGVLGTASAVAFAVSQYGTHLKAAIHSKYKPIGLFVSAAFVSILVHGLTDVTALWHQTGLMLLFMMSGLSLVANEQEAASALRITSRMQKGLQDFEDAVTIRQNVFVIEQGFSGEFDDTDQVAWHVVLYDGEKPIATGRTFLQGDHFVIGRVAVCKEYRRLHIGSIVIQKLEEKIEELGGTKAQLSAQVQAQGFYEKLGYHAESNRYYYDEHCPHIDMVKSLI